MRGRLLKLNSEELGWLSILCSFRILLVLTLGLRYSSEKRGAAENEGVDFEIGDIGNSAHLY